LHRDPGAAPARQRGPGGAAAQDLRRLGRRRSAGGGWLRRPIHLALPRRRVPGLHLPNCSSRGHFAARRRSNGGAAASVRQSCRYESAASRAPGRLVSSAPLRNAVSASRGNRLTIDETPAPSPAAPLPGLWRFGDAVLDEQQASLHVGGAPVSLDRSSHDVLLALLRHSGEVVTKEELLEAGWPGRVVSENSLAKAVSRLRQALGKQAAGIRAVHGY